MLLVSWVENHIADRLAVKFNPVQRNNAWVIKNVKFTSIIGFETPIIMLYVPSTMVKSHDH